MATLNPEPVSVLRVGEGMGLAHCDILDVLVVARFCDPSLHVYTGPRLGEGPMYQFCLEGVGLTHLGANFLAFAGSAGARYLLATDRYNSAVHVIDVVHKRHIGYVAAPDTIAWPRSVAARGAFVAVSAWIYDCSGAHTIQLFEGSGATWTPIRVLGGDFGVPGNADGQLHAPLGMRFSGCGDDMTVVVADEWNDRVSIFRVCDGAFVGHVATDLSKPVDVEEFENGWLVACGESRTIEFIGMHDGERSTMKMKTSFGDLHSLATVRGVGLVVRVSDDTCRVEVFATYDAISQATMGVHRVLWMGAVVRAIMLCF